jgi:hypothetical protein
MVVVVYVTLAFHNVWNHLQFHFCCCFLSKYIFAFKCEECMHLSTLELVAPGLHMTGKILRFLTSVRNLYLEAESA